VSGSRSVDGGAAIAPRVALRLRGVRKAFPGLVAVRDVDLDVEAGEVRALVGENGAGKSTLIKIIAGAVTPTAGVVEIGGVPLAHARPSLASALSVAVIHQDRQIGADLSVCENVLLGRLPSRLPGIIDWTEAHRRTEALLARVGLDLDPRTPARQLSVSEHQMLEIARALGRDARIVIMDEPTASLTGNEVLKLFEVIRGLRIERRTVIYISHHLEEVFQLADTVTVMRDGSVVGTYPAAELDPHRLTELMFGREVNRLEQEAEVAYAALGEVALSARDLVVAPHLRGVSLQGHAGEILCVTGGIGSGRRELARCLVGAEAPERGEVRIGAAGERIRSPRQALRLGVGFLPDDRKLEGLLLPLDLVDNVDLSRLTIGGDRLALPGRRKRITRDLARDLRLRYSSLDQPVQELSGGNQQKALIARLLAVGVKVLVLDEPTAGVDVNTKLEIYELLRGLARQGACLIVCSSDFEEIRLLADRVLVMGRGRVVHDIPPRQLSEEHMLGLDTEEEAA
jgi:ABC-type sugar transport system ATPase subunit